MVAPLSGVRVVEATSWVAAPSAGAIMADMGADVIKVEPPRGDAMRGLLRPAKVDGPLGEVDFPFTVDNRGKRSVAIALNTEDGGDVMRRLISDADVFLCNLLPERQARYGLDAETLLAENPRLVHATLTGYGLEGPDADRPGYDVTTFFGRGAITDSLTDPGAVAPHPRPAQGDHATGLAMFGAILAALRVVEKTGEGQIVDVNLLATAAWTMGSDLAAVLVDGRQPSKRDRHHLITPLANRFKCKEDRWIIFNMPEPSWWPDFCAAIDREDLLADERFESPKDRFDNMPELIDLLDEVMATKTMHEWGEIFDEHDLIWGPASTMKELTEDPQAEAAGIFPTITHPDGEFRTVGAPMSISGADVAPSGPAPTVGQHTREVLADAGLGADEIDALVSSGAVSTGDD